MSKTIPGPFLGQAGPSELQAQLRLADAAGADHDRERALQEPAAEQLVESFNAGRKPRGIIHSCRNRSRNSSIIASVWLAKTANRKAPSGPRPE